MSKLTSKERNRIPDSEFAVPSQRKYPIEDRTHAINALSRVSQFGTADLKKTVREKVYKKYPSLKRDGD